MEANSKVKVGLVGAGYVAAHHARALHSLPYVEIVGIADPDAERARKLAKQFAIPRVYASLQAMAEARPEVIHVLTPPATHAELVLEALDMGCHVLVEKPMAETVADCDRMIERARAKGLVLSVNHSARMEPIVLRALELLQRMPIVTIAVLVDELRVTKEAARVALEQLAERGVVRNRGRAGRTQLFAAEELISLLSRPFGSDARDALDKGRALLTG